VARLSGDDFGVLLTGIDGTGEAVRRAGLIAQAVGAPRRMGGQEISPSITIGIAPGSSGSDAEELLRNAHVAMYRAKARAPGQREIFDTSMHGRSLDRFRLEYDFHRAVERDELCLHFQPIVRLCDGTLAGFEALPSWPGRGDFAGRPGELLRVAEETGLILPVSYRALDQACRTLADWARHGIGMPLHLGLPDRLLTDMLLVKRLGDFLGRAGVDPSLLVLEVAESAVREGAEAVAAPLAALRALGVRVAVAGVGRADTLPGSLQRSAVDLLKVDLLKVDRALSSQIRESGDRPEALCAVLAFAQSRGLEVIAEGIDLHEQVAELADLGCGFGQGPLFSHPVDEATARRMCTSPPLWGTPLAAEPESGEVGCCASDPAGAVEAPS
jgi:predicted signal transduction protein with EAL and GGDEF domain